MSKYNPHPKMPHKAEYLAVGRGTGSSKAISMQVNTSAKYVDINRSIIILRYSGCIDRIRLNPITKREQ